ncbi:hypothetical protein SDC9_60739 [bioreactor metagenome]|uniref:Carbohydrate-binding domain-containing protein n=1 Tax=bioreactor metagenome TaxID=1076179 RepID=A0A644XEN3_9ZZZZ|nr:hypothetical protein [Oscillospiraceae bacterium]
MKRIIAFVLVAVMAASLMIMADAAYPTEITVPKTAAAITIDGVKDEAYGAGFDFSATDMLSKTPDDVDYAYPAGDARTSEYTAQFAKLSSKGYFAWDEKYLYAFISVKDPNQVKMTGASNHDSASRIEFILYPAGATSFEKFYVALNSEGKSFQLSNPTATLSEEKMKSALTVDGDTINYEFCIEWAAWGIDAKVGAETLMGFAQAGMYPGYITYAFGGCFKRSAEHGVKTVLADVPVKEVPKEDPKEEPKEETPVETGDEAGFVVLALALSLGGALVVRKAKQK